MLWFRQVKQQLRVFLCVPHPSACHTVGQAKGSRWRSCLYTHAFLDTTHYWQERAFLGQSSSARVITQKWKNPTSSGAVRCTPASVWVAGISPVPCRSNMSSCSVRGGAQGEVDTPCLSQTGPVPVQLGLQEAERSARKARGFQVCALYSGSAVEFISSLEISKLGEDQPCWIFLFYFLCSQAWKFMWSHKSMQNQHNGPVSHISSPYIVPSQ